MKVSEFLDKYGNILVSFSEYYKYVFTFTSKSEAYGPISISIGGDSADIYRLHVTTDPTSIRELFARETINFACLLEPFEEIELL